MVAGTSWLDLRRGGRRDCPSLARAFGTCNRTWGVKASSVADRGDPSKAAGRSRSPTTRSWAAVRTQSSPLGGPADQPSARSRAAARPSRTRPGRGLLGGLSGSRQPGRQHTRQHRRPPPRTGLRLLRRGDELDVASEVDGIVSSGDRGPNRAYIPFRNGSGHRAGAPVPLRSHERHVLDREDVDLPGSQKFGRSAIAS